MMINASDDEIALIFQLDVIDDVMVNAESAKEIDHVVGVLAKFGNLRLQSESVVFDITVVRRRDKYHRLAITAHGMSQTRDKLGQLGGFKQEFYPFYCSYSLRGQTLDIHFDDMSSQFGDGEMVSHFRTKYVASKWYHERQIIRIKMNLNSSCQYDSHFIIRVNLYSMFSPQTRFHSILLDK